MRISDWSSDVCSSDLCKNRGPKIGEKEGSLIALMRVRAAQRPSRKSFRMESLPCRAGSAVGSAMTAPQILRVMSDHSASARKTVPSSSNSLRLCMLAERELYAGRQREMGDTGQP